VASSSENGNEIWVPQNVENSWTIWGSISF